MTKTDVVLIGAGIMSATLGTLLRLVEPDWSITVIERLDGVAAESSNPFNNAGTGHSALCELNYTPELPDGSIDVIKAVFVNEQFQVRANSGRTPWKRVYSTTHGASSTPSRTCPSCTAPSASTIYVGAVRPWSPTRCLPARRSSTTPMSSRGGCR